MTDPDALRTIDLDKCFAGEQTVTKREFSRLSAWGKGYVCYMLGARKDQPNVPSNLIYRSRIHRQEFERGQQMGAIHAADMP